MDKQLVAPWKEYLFFIFIFGLALLWATKIDTITGMASTDIGSNSTMTIFSDTDAINRSQGELVRFNANYTNSSGIPIDDSADNGTCLIQFGGSAAIFNMTFNLSGTGIYEYTRTFPVPDTYTWNVTCFSNRYNTLATSDTSLIRKTYCGFNVSGSINLTADLDMTNGSTECSASGLAINTSHITLDCNNHEIAGIGNSSGIYLLAVSNVTVKNCTIKGFQKGISIDSASSGNRIYYNNFSSNALHAYSDNPNNNFNTTVAGEPRGNAWDNTALLAIFDSDADNYGDFGQQYPYNKTNGGKVSKNVQDYGPVASKLDSDNDGSPDTEDCAPSDPTVLAPRNDIIITTNTTLCAGTYQLNDSLWAGIIRFNTSNITLDCNGATLVGNRSGSGIFDSMPNNTIFGCNVTDYYTGIYLYRANSTNLTGVRAYDNSDAGVRVYNSSRCNLSSIDAYDNAESGVFLTTYSQYNTLSGISAHDNNLGIYLYYSGNNTIVDSDLSDNTWQGMFLERSDWNVIRDTDSFGNNRGFHLSYAHQNTFEDLLSYGNSEGGVVVWFSDVNTFLNVSSYSNSGSGIIIDTGRFNKVKNCTVQHNARNGIVSNVSRYTKIYNSTVFNNTLVCVLLQSTINNSVLENNISSCGYGLKLTSASGDDVSFNNISDSTVSGVLVNPSYGVTFEGNTFSGNTAAGMNLTGNVTLDVFNNTFTGSPYGIWLQSTTSANITNNTIVSNTRYGLLAVNSTLVPPGMASSNTFGTANTLGMLTFNWYVQARALDWLGSNYSGVPVNFTVVGQSSPERTAVTGSNSLTSFVIAAEYIIDNTGQRVNRTYNVTAQLGDFYGFNTTNITQNMLNSGSGPLFISLDRALPPTVRLISPGNNTSTTNHAVTFTCNASHEGGLANMTLYHNVTGNWTSNLTDNLTGTSNQTSFALTLPDADIGWNCLAFSAFGTSAFAQSNFTLDLYTPPAPPGGGGSTGGGGETTTDETPSDEGPGDTGPSDEGPSEGPSEGPAEAPAADAGGEEIQVAEVNMTTQVSCEEEVTIVEEEISTEDLLQLIDIPEGYVIAAKPFKAKCLGGETFKMSLVVPDNLEDIQAIRCAGDACTARTTTVTNRICPDKEIETFREEVVFNVSTAALNMTSVAGNMSEGNRSLKSGNVSIDFGEDVEASLSMATENQKQPMNKNVRIVGSPIVVSIQHAKERQGRVNVTIPYVVHADDDEYSIAVYAKEVDANGTTNWLYVGGSIDTTNKVVKAEVNLSLYAQEGKVTLAPITILCHECGEAEFSNLFTPNPDTRQAIILLHGLWGVGKVWEGLVNEFRATNQPYQLWTFHYLANKPLEDSATDLANYLEANRHRFDRVYIVGYSLGGFVTQAMLDHVYNVRQNDSSQYTFFDKLKKVLLVGVPNQGSPVAGYLTTFLSEYINSEATEVIPLNDAIKDLLESGVPYSPVPNISYYTIAGTKSYPFMTRLGLEKRLFQGELNDGLVPISSAQNVGNTTFDDFCINFWTQPVVHTLLIDDRLVQKIMGQIIASDIYDELAVEDVTTNLFGFSNYFELEIDACSPDDLYVVVGKETAPEDIERAAYCACGNGICDGLESADTCPEDCGIIEKPLVQRIIERSLSYLALIIALFLIGGFIFVLYEDKKHKKEALEKKRHIHIPPGFNIKEVPGVEDVKYMKTELMDLKSVLKQLQEHRWLIVGAESKQELSDEARRIQERIDRINETLLREGIAQSMEKEASKSKAWPSVPRPAGRKKRKSGSSARKKPKSALKKK